MSDSEAFEQLIFSFIYGFGFLFIGIVFLFKILKCTTGDCVRLRGEVTSSSSTRFSIYYVQFRFNGYIYNLPAYHNKSNYKDGDIVYIL